MLAEACVEMIISITQCHAVNILRVCKQHISDLHDWCVPGILPFCRVSSNSGHLVVRMHILVLCLSKAHASNLECALVDVC